MDQRMMMTPEIADVLTGAGLHPDLLEDVLNEPLVIYRVNARPGPHVPTVDESMKELNRNPRFSVDLSLSMCPWSGEVSGEDAKKLTTAFDKTGQDYELWD